MKMKLLQTENRKTLLAFALGEFILIVIGILLALQIDNWNENRKARKTERIYLLALQDEFQNNLAELERVMRLNTRNADRALELSEFTGPFEPELTETEFDSLGMCLNSEVQYRPGSGVLEEMISSGKLELISNDHLRFELSSWQSIMQFIHFQEEEHSRIRFNLLDMLLTKGNNRLALLNGLGDLYGISPSEFPDGNLMFLQSLEFDNQLIAFIVTARFLNMRYTRLEDKINTVLSIIESEMNE